MPNQTPRERRLQREFEKMKALRSEYSLFDFLCADLTAAEATEYLRVRMSASVVKDAWPGFVSSEQFEQTHKNAPEKYIIIFNCRGLQRLDDGDVVVVNDHAMEVVFGYNYPTVKPKFIWLTPIWHPNFRQTDICIEGHSFAIGLTLDQIVTEVGRMIQYQSYNIKDPLNKDAVAWVREHEDQFPIDDRDILDKRRKVGSQQRLVQILPPEGDVVMQHPGQLFELIELDPIDGASLRWDDSEKLKMKDNDKE